MAIRLNSTASHQLSIRALISNHSLASEITYMYLYAWKLLPELIHTNCLEMLIFYKVVCEGSFHKRLMFSLFLRQGHVALTEEIVEFSQPCLPVAERHGQALTYGDTNW